MLLRPQTLAPKKAEEDNGKQRGGQKDGVVTREDYEAPTNAQKFGFSHGRVCFGTESATANESGPEYICRLGPNELGGSPGPGRLAITGAPEGQ